MARYWAAVGRADGEVADGRAAMVQPYLSAVESRGESALVYLDGAMVHAVRKGPMLPDGVAHPVHGVGRV